jgi:HK97 gp10 family phage protein
MANSLFIDVSKFNEAIKKIGSIKNGLINDIDGVLDAHAEDIATKAKQLAPKDIGGLVNSISANKSKKLEKHIVVNVFYAAFLEFGTGKYAAEYVASLPDNWQEFAATFKGQKGEGTFDEFILRIIEWVHRIGAAGRFSVKTQRRLGTKSQQNFEDAEAAYQIVLAILRKGIHPHPYLFPAFEQQKPLLLKDIESILKQL